jgi:hydrogenase maturation protease
MTENARTLVLGIGNPLFGDDGVGIEVARRIEERSGKNGVDIVEASASGLELLDIVSGYDRLIVIDATATGDGYVGKLHRLERDDFADAVHPAPKHRMNLFTTLEFGRSLKVDVPRETVIYAVEIEDAREFREGYSAELEDAIPGIVDTILENESLGRD